jgi:hypothetical protein
MGKSTRGVRGMGQLVDQRSEVGSWQQTLLASTSAGMPPGGHSEAVVEVPQTSGQGKEEPSWAQRTTQQDRLWTHQDCVQRHCNLRKYRKAWLMDSEPGPGFIISGQNLPFYTTLAPSH